MGAQPGDCTDSNSFTLPSHQSNNLTAQESAECIADHFADISKSFSLSTDLLPEHVHAKLKSYKQLPPVITVEDTWRKIETAKKPRSGVPQQITKEFSVELASPLSRIIEKIATTATWPGQWKKEYITPIGKVKEPENEG